MILGDRMRAAMRFSLSVNLFTFIYFQPGADDIAKKCLTKSSRYWPFEVKSWKTVISTNSSDTLSFDMGTLNEHL